MTKITILGEEPQKKELKKIEFVKLLSIDGFSECYSLPQSYLNIELVCRSYTPEHDLMYAYKDNRNNGYAYLGHFNDGVV